MTARELFKRAAKRLEVTGWKRGSVGTEQGPNCAFGALVFESDGIPNDYKIRYRCEDIARRALGQAIIWYNDEPGRTKEQVIYVLKTLGNGKRIDRKKAGLTEDTQAKGTTQP